MLNPGDQVYVIGFPHSEIMEKCTQSIELNHNGVAPLSRICVHGNLCSCIEFGEVAKEFKKAGFNGRDTIDNLSSGDL